MKQTRNHPEENAELTAELIRQAQDGSQDAYAVLRAQYAPLLESSVARFGPTEMTRQERADMYEEAERIFLSALTSYDTAQNTVDFGLYAKICLRNGLISEWRRQNTQRKMRSLPLSEEEISSEKAPMDAFVEDERFRLLCRRVRGYLSDFENRVWWQYVMGVSVSDIAEELGCDPKSVHNAVYRIRRKLRDRLGSEDDTDGGHTLR